MQQITMQEHDVSWMQTPALLFTVHLPDEFSVEVEDPEAALAKYPSLRDVLLQLEATYRRQWFPRSPMESFRSSAMLARAPTLSIDELDSFFDALLQSTMILSMPYIHAASQFGRLLIFLPQPAAISSSSVSVGSSVVSSRNASSAAT